MSQHIKTVFFIIFLSSLTLHSLSTTTTFFPFKHENIYFSGRSYEDKEGLRFDWPCSSIHFCFINTTKVTWIGKDTFGNYNITSSEGNSSLILSNKKSNLTIAQFKSPNANKICITITKITEDHYGPTGTHQDAIFKGIELEGVSSTLIPDSQTYQYQLEFLGDSITSAFGVMTNANPKCMLNLKGTQNCLESWAVHLSDKLNANFRVMAESGKGVVKNAMGIPPPAMPYIFTKITSNSQENTYNYQDGYIPDAVIIKLGPNDFSSLIKPTEKYFTHSYEQMMSGVVQRVLLNTKRETKIINVCIVDEIPEICEYIKNAIKSFRYAYKKVYYVEVPEKTMGKDTAGCIGHFNVKGQRKIADVIWKEVEEILNL